MEVAETPITTSDREASYHDYHKYEELVRTHESEKQNLIEIKCLIEHQLEEAMEINCKLLEKVKRLEG